MNNDSKMTQEKPNSKLTVSINADTGFWKDKNFEHEFGNFTVITGVNGSGKTKLLEYIAKDADITSKKITRFVETSYKIPYQQYTNEIQSTVNYTFNVNNVNDQGHVLVHNCKSGDNVYWSQNTIQANNLVAKLDYQILLDIIKQRETFNNDDTLLMAELDNSKKYKTEGYKVERFFTANEQNDLPWDRIDRILAAFALNIRIDRRNLNAGISFLRKFLQEDGTHEEKQILAKDLSSGEQVAFAVALWTWGSATGQRSELLLVDEFDAHLNPSIAEKFIEVIQTYFVNEGVRVIMTTHSPSTVAFAKEHNTDILWMEDGEINRDIKPDKIINTLSNGLITVNEDSFECLIELSKSEKILFVEDDRTKQYLEKATKCLKSNALENVLIFNCGSASKIAQYIALNQNNRKRVIKVALLDNDQGYKDALRALEKIVNRLRCTVVKVSEEENAEIEDLFPITKGLQKKQKKQAVDELLKNPNDNAFDNFRQLLTKLHECFR